MRHLLVLMSAAVVVTASAFAAAPLPRDSVYQLNAQLTDDQSRTMVWGSARGRPQVVTMLYTSCKFVCPMIIDSGKAIEQGRGLGHGNPRRVTLPAILAFAPPVSNFRTT